MTDYFLAPLVRIIFPEHLSLEFKNNSDITNANADAAGGLPISDAGGLDLDSKLANTNEVTAARMGALTDWINGGRLDLILDIIAADVVNLDGAAMRGTDNAALASVLGALNDVAAAGDPTAFPCADRSPDGVSRVRAVQDLWRDAPDLQLGTARQVRPLSALV